MFESRVVRFAEIPVVARGNGVETKPLVMESTGAQSFVSGMTTFPVGAALKLHKHNTEEMVVLLEGEATVEVGEARYDIVPYDTTHVPAGIFHRFVNRGTTPMRILWVYGATHVTRTFADTGVTVEHLSEGDKGGVRR
ncbi:MAG: cupin domain-containing protein [candidate division NC10 bacterium]|nr:cupin domain-containing protein [candidate division NC10 bacterium]